VAAAKRFLLAKLEEQSVHDGVHLSELEKKMFLCSESTASHKVLTLAKEFDTTCDDAEYEKKISDLLKAALRRDEQTGEGVDGWKRSLKALGRRTSMAWSWSGRPAYLSHKEVLLATFV
jgi:hypothetical protein